MFFALRNIDFVALTQFKLSNGLPEGKALTGRNRVLVTSGACRVDKEQIRILQEIIDLANRALNGYETSALEFEARIRLFGNAQDVLPELIRHGLEGDAPARDVAGTVMFVYSFKSLRWHERNWQIKNCDRGHIMGDALERLLKMDRESLLGVRNWDGYLHQVMRNCVVEWLKLSKRHSAISLSGSQGEEPGPDEPSMSTAGRPDRPTNPGNIAELRELSALLDDCVRRLLPQHQKIVRLKALGILERMIAEVLRCPPGTVATTYKRALKALKECLEAKGVNR
jgi:RNA polymerase sigma factor (sigma-70 family)